MMPFHALVVRGLLCATVAISLALPVIAAEEAKPAEGKDKASAEPSAEELGPVSATVDLASEQMRLIMGGTKGKGVLHYNGEDHEFTFKSASASVGAKMVTSVSATGEVYGLKKLDDFAGEYTTLAKAAMAGTAEVAATYTNDKGVTINLRGTVKGAGLAMGGGIATIVLVKPPSVK
jgi:hypothetical protein